MHVSKIIITFSFFILIAAYTAMSAPQAIVDLISPDSTVKQIASGITQPEGPSCDSTGTLYYCDFVALPDPQLRGKVYKIGQTTPYVSNLEVPSGTAFDSHGRLLISGQKKIWRREASGTLTVIAQGDSLKQANDLSMASNDGFFFSANAWAEESYVYYCSPTGKVSKKLLSFPGSNGFPNGVEYWEERGILLVCLSQTNKIMKYQVDNQMNITNTAGTQFCSVSQPDGLTIDEKGNVWVASSGKAVYVFDSTGQSKGSLPMTVSVTNVCFGGADGKVLYITGGNGVYSAHTFVKGRKISFTGITNTGFVPALLEPEQRITLGMGKLSNRRAFQIYSIHPGKLVCNLSGAKLNAVK